MTQKDIDEAIATIKDEKWICCQEKYIEALNLMENIMHKFQKIEEIVTKWQNEPKMKFGTSYYNMTKITEVVEDGNVDN